MTTCHGFGSLHCTRSTESATNPYAHLLCDICYRRMEAARKKANDAMIPRDPGTMDPDYKKRWRRNVRRQKATA